MMHIDGLREISRTEGMPGLWRGSILALVGVSNGAIQFMAYEEMKRFLFRRKRLRYEKSGREWTPEADRLVCIFHYLSDLSKLVSKSNTVYTIISGVSKLFSLTITYPYQVVRSRLQVCFTFRLFFQTSHCLTE